MVHGIGRSPVFEKVVVGSDLRGSSGVVRGGDPVLEEVMASAKKQWWCVFFWGGGCLRRSDG